MRTQVIFTREFRQAYRQLPRHMQKIVDDKICLLCIDPTYPSLQVHRHRRVRSVWICYINRGIRLLFQNKGGVIYLCNVGDHRIEDHINNACFA